MKIRRPAMFIPGTEANDEAFTRWCEEYAPADLDTDSIEAQDLFQAWLDEGEEAWAESVEP